MSKREIKVLNRLSMKLTGVPYDMLGREEQDFICSEAFARNLI